MREGRWVSRARGSKGARTWPENAWTWARPWRGDRVREVEDELTGGDSGTEREGAGAQEGNSADRSAPQSSERERERERERETERERERERGK
jgi:hypothetical protein